MTPAELYSALYAGLYGGGPMCNARSDIFAQVVKDYVEPGAEILEIGVGRGRLMRLLRDAGYKVCGTEIAESLFDHDLVGLDVMHASDADLHLFADGSYDAVVSNDVFEHFRGEAAVVAAIENAVRISRRWVIISVGTFASHYKVDDPTLNVELHNVIRPHEWWLELFGKFLTVKRKFMLAGSFLCVGEKGGEKGETERMRWQF